MRSLQFGIDISLCCVLCEKDVLYLMQRKYSEVVNFVPNFPNNEYRQRSREPPNNQKLSPVMGVRPNNNPNPYIHSQFQPLIKQDHLPRETLRIPSSSFQIGDRSAPNFNVNLNLVQTL